MKKPPTIQLSKLQPKFHLLKHDRKPYLTPQTESLLDIVKDLYLKGKLRFVSLFLQISRHKFRDLRNQSLRNDFLKEAAGLLKRFPKRPRWEWLVIALLLGLLFARPAGAVIHDAPGVIAPAPKITLVKPVKILSVPIPKKVHSVALKPVAPPQPVYAAPVGVTNCGSDPNMAFIYQHESGCRTNAIGPNGPCGLGQALPCSKLPCSLSDWACQNAWFTAYALRTYGSTYAAMLFWQSHSWW